MRTTTNLILIFTVSIFLFSACGSSKSNDKTSFSNCEELISYTQYRYYDAIKSEWGPGSIGETWDANAGTGDIEMKVKVKWDNIKCNGKSVVIQFTNLGTDKSPSKYDGIYCDDYK